MHTLAPKGTCTRAWPLLGICQGRSRSQTAKCMAGVAPGTLLTSTCMHPPLPTQLDFPCSGHLLCGPQDVTAAVSRGTTKDAWIQLAVALPPAGGIKFPQPALGGQNCRAGPNQPQLKPGPPLSVTSLLFPQDFRACGPLFPQLHSALGFSGASLKLCQQPQQ